jgi:hypothetical protein
MFRNWFVLVVAIALVTAGCGGSPAAQAPAAAASPVQATTAPPPSPHPEQVPDPAGPPRCTTAELSGSLGQSEGAAGSIYVPLILTNTGKRTCALRGFPGVSYVAGDDGHQVGPAAEWQGERGGSVRLDPGKAATAQLRLVNVHNFDEAACKPTPVRGFRVYPPGDTASLFVPMDGTGCAATPPSPQMSVETLK